MSNAWDWSKVEERGYWMDPSDESYYYAEKWKRERKGRILDLGCALLPAYRAARFTGTSRSPLPACPGRTGW